MDLRLYLAIVLLSQALHFSIQDDNRESVAATCTKNFHCGNLSFMFPFTDWSSYNCGLCMVDCRNASFPRIALNYPVEQWFEAKSIENSTIALSDPYLQEMLHEQNCLSFDDEIRLPNSPSISFFIVNNITLFRCYGDSVKNQKFNDSFHGYEYYGGCQSFTLYYKYPNSLSPTPPIGSIDPSCTAIYLPVNKAFSRDNKSDVPEVFRLLGADFDLRWHVSDDCYECHHRGGVCQTEWSKGPHCVNGGRENILGIG